MLPLARQSTPTYVNKSPWGAPGHNVHSAQTDSHIELQSSLLVYLGLRESYKLSTHKGRPTIREQFVPWEMEILRLFMDNRK